MKKILQIRDLVDAGVYFGHSKKRTNPKMAKYIIGFRDDYYVIDLYQTIELLDEALKVIANTVENKGDILFVGTKKQAQDLVESYAKKCNTMYVSTRWVGGLLTNFSITRKSIDKMLKLHSLLEGNVENRTKQEKLLMSRELARLENTYNGIKDMVTLPSLLVVIDSKQEKTAIKEAKKMGIPVIALVDTNSDPEIVNYPIPANDDGMQSIELFLSMFAETILDSMASVKNGTAGKSEITENQSNNQNSSKRVVKSSRGLM